VNSGNTSAFESKLSARNSEPVRTNPKAEVAESETPRNEANEKYTFYGVFVDAGERFVQDAKPKALIRVLTPILSSFRDRYRLMHNKIVATMSMKMKPRPTSENVS
jgi:hypothetical protein